MLPVRQLPSGQIRMSNAHWIQLQGDRNKSYFRPGGAEVVQADPGRVLCFAYGSALAPAFRESRGVHSLQIIPGRVSNFKLMFQHQGGAACSHYLLFVLVACPCRLWTMSHDSANVHHQESTVHHLQSCCQQHIPRVVPHIVFYKSFNSHLSLNE